MLTPGKKRGPGRPSNAEIAAREESERRQVAIRSPYSALEKQLVVEYVISHGGDVQAAQASIVLDEAWTREGVPAMSTMLDWCRVNPEASKLLSVHRTYGTRDKLVDAINDVVGRASKLAAKPLDDEVEPRIEKLSNSASKLIDSWTALVYGSKSGVPASRLDFPSSGGNLIPRKGTTQNIPENASATADMQPDLQAAGFSVNLFSSREVTMLLNSVKNLSPEQLVEGLLNANKAQAGDDEGQDQEAGS